MRVLVSGASGFIGQALCAALSRSHVVYGTTRRPDAQLPLDVHKLLWNGDTVGLENIPSIDVVVHLAARAHIVRDGSADPLSEFRLVNTQGTLNLARQAAAAGVRRFVFVSSVGVNGNRTGERPFSERDNPAPHDLYAVSKYEAERELLELATESKMQVVIIRPPLVYGPDAPGNFGRLTRTIKSGIPLPLGSIHNRRSLIALDNLVDFIQLCLEHPNAANETFLISDGEDVSVTELLQKVARAYGRKVWLLPVPAGVLRRVATVLGKPELAVRLLDSLVIDSSKARERLGWRPVVTVDEQLGKMAKNDPNP